MQQFINNIITKLDAGNVATLSFLMICITPITIIILVIVIGTKKIYINVCGKLKIMLNYDKSSVDDKETNQQ